MSLTACDDEFGIILKALRFAARKHSGQQRKGGTHAPYINHPIDVAEILWRTGGVRDAATLAAALLHDTVEDTGTRPEEIREAFGEEVLALVMEVTDDKSLPKAERKQNQIKTAPHKSPKARQIKLGDKISNVYEIAHDPPRDWSLERRKEYLDWTEQVINGLRGQNPALEARYDEVLAEARQMLQDEMMKK
ncbi:MAG: bifunctional (p)ppGpp synthetase/guanosine-3',5'-bis(diphosphate) 3'-pyrophosphohydrolase [Chloroflexi bacterium]|nr:bifunctional (p)ppGpp synthetase/guanosine-3',5'-bis(diphosphate) 3'-pyrophosphohydrolase [Chloroflexota bacterium]